MPLCVSTKKLEEMIRKYEAEDRDVAAALKELRRARAKLSQIRRLDELNAAHEKNNG